MSEGDEIPSRAQLRRKEQRAYNVLMWAIGIFVSLGGMVNGWIVNKMVDLELRVVSIEASRFTSGDGHEVFKMLASIQTRQAEFERRLTRLEK